VALEHIEQEVRNFLATDTAEILCVRGSWGVGKTFGWKKFFANAKDDGHLKLEKYSYVSLFGLNSLDDLRYAVFERTTAGNNIGNVPDNDSLNQLLSKASGLVRRLRGTAELGASMIGRENVVNLLAKSAFLSVKNQIICIDDIERSGKGLDTADVLGLASFLKEERGCKVVLLLNDQELGGNNKTEFEKQIEKVADLNLVFDLTPEEAVSIALIEEDKATRVLKPLIVQLGITNIRIIKKIETMTKKLVRLLEGFDDELVDQAIATLALGSWSVQLPQSAPSLEWIRNLNSISNWSGAVEQDEDTQKWMQLLERYPYRHANRLDQEILDGAEKGYFIEAEIKKLAEAIQAQIAEIGSDREFTRVWEELYHGSLAVDDDVFLDALIDAAKKEAKYITHQNMNSAIVLLRQSGREVQADELVSSYVAANDDKDIRFFDLADSPFLDRNNVDPTLKKAFEKRYDDYVDDREPIEVLKSIGGRNGWSNEDLRLMAQQSSDGFEKMFEALDGSEMKSSIENILAIGRGHSDDAAAIREASINALKKIASKSPLRARKVRRFGVDLGDGN